MTNARVPDALSGFRAYLKGKRTEAFLDSNILMHAEQPEWRGLIIEACALLDVRISDTVYWEFLRNVNIEKFRKRRAALASWPGGDLLREDRIKREDEEVRAMYNRLVLLLLRAYADDPARVMRFLTPDLWIAAAAVHYRSDHVITTNAADFPPCLFMRKATAGAPRRQIHLLVFDRLTARAAWKQLKADPTVTLRCESLV